MTRDQPTHHKYVTRSPIRRWLSRSQSHMFTVFTGLYLFRVAK